MKAGEQPHQQPCKNRVSGAPNCLEGCPAGQRGQGAGVGSGQALSPHEYTCRALEARLPWLPAEQRLPSFILTR